MSGGPDVLFWCVWYSQLAGQWGTPHYSQAATEEWIHLTALWGTWTTINIENHFGGPRCVIFDHTIKFRCLSNRGGSQPASEERPLLPTGHRGTLAVWGTLNIENHVRVTWCVISGQIIVSWYIHDVWYSQPASEAHTITPNRPLRNGCIWQHFGARKTHYTLKIILGGLDV